MAVLLMMSLAVVTTLIPNLSYLEGLKYVETGKAAVMLATEPVMATIFGLLLFKEVPTIWGFIGMCLVVTAIVLLNVKVKPEPVTISKPAIKGEPVGEISK
ncbi:MULTISPECIES: DMT family transporter [Sporomusa]|uniref:DMT family transporter n=1 Tax=Sporomusa TaxID=2375 RepID=UPI003158266E